MILKFIKIALTRIQNYRVKLEKNFASFPKVGHDGAKDFAAEVFLDDCLELRDLSGLLPEDLGIYIPLEVVVTNPGCKGATDSHP